MWPRFGLSRLKCTLRKLNTICVARVALTETASCESAAVRVYMARIECDRLAVRTL